MDTSVIFQERLPRRPYCTNDPSQGLIIRPATAALEHQHIQPNAPLAIAWLVFDIDRPGAAFAWEDVGLPPPTITAINPANGHAHLFYGLSTPVGMSNAAREAPIRYAAAIQAAFLVALCADPGYAGLIAKNPLHPIWRTLWVNHLYDLAELAEYVDLKRRQAPRSVSGLGRNCQLFDELRAWAYRWALEYQRNGAGADQWARAVLGQAERLNTFDVPLPYGEVKATAKSVSKWVWQRFDAETFRAIQSARGKRGGRPATTTGDDKPWVTLNVSRATYYRRRKKADLIPAS